MRTAESGLANKCTIPPAAELTVTTLPITEGRAEKSLQKVFGEMLASQTSLGAECPQLGPWPKAADSYSSRAVG